MEIAVTGMKVISGHHRIMAAMAVNPGKKIRVMDIKTGEVSEAYPETLELGYAGIVELLKR